MGKSDKMHFLQLIITLAVILTIPPVNLSAFTINIFPNIQPFLKNIYFISNEKTMF